MTGNLTQFAAKKLLDLTLGLANYPIPTTHLALFTGDPGETGSLTNEVTGGSYARVALSGKLGATTLGTGLLTNTSAITFANPSAPWGMVSHAAIMDAPTSGNALVYYPFSTALFVPSGGFPVTFSIGAFILSALFSDPTSLTQYTAKKWLDHITGVAAFTMPTTDYLGLFSSDPGATGSLVGEITTGGYARQPITGVMDATVLATGTAQNNSDITFPNPTADYSVTHFGVLDASTSGNMLLRRARTTTLNVKSGRAPVKVATGSLTLTAF